MAPTVFRLASAAVTAFLLALPADVLVSAAPLSTRQDTSTYDYIVVGSGAGGIPLAAQLSASGARTLLIERGPPSSGRWGGNLRVAPWLQGTNLSSFDVPSLYNEQWAGTGWEDGIYCDDVEGAIASCVLGGGTAINAGLWWKPASMDWDDTFPANVGWGSGDLAPATERVFNKIPGTHVPSSDGVISMQQGPGVLEWAFETAGWERELSNETPEQKTQRRVFTNTTFMYEHGERSGPMATYLVEASARPNFELWQNTMVERVIRDGSKVTGLELKSAGNGGHDGSVGISANGGSVILSAGAFGTPKILFRSGIGPQDMLEVVRDAESDKMIAQDQWIDLPVGKNLLDNINTDIVIHHPNVVPYDWQAAYNSPIESDKQNYLKNRAGILAQCASNLNPMVWEPVTGSDGKYRQLQWTARVAPSLGISNDDGKAMTISNYLGLGQVARGRTTITSELKMIVETMPSPSQNAADREAIIHGIESMRSALSNVSDLTILSPKPEVSASDYVDSTEHAAVNHWLGSCKLGTDDGRNGGTAVVDPDTKVYGMDNLFVVDGSIFPELTTSNPSAAIVVAAERAAERILALRK
ncbi:hypothetical protein AAFC00_000461 [Neodothiora populina]|uniref:Glucose-methanol-choline oxidoreductase N-terminal domain-containing protein n=1 Tax=Neodothiora populina TaxID=2781224 RepID=A0ABR3PCY8_9PEZI